MGCGRNGFSRLAASEHERLALVYTGRLMVYSCGDLSRTSHAPPPHPLQRLGRRLAAEVLPLLLRKLTDGEVHFLLACARSAEGQATDLHLRAARARVLRPTAHRAGGRL